MKILKCTIFLLVIVFFFNACICSVTYPKSAIAQSLVKLVKKECNQDSKVYLIGRTLYLDMELDEIASAADDKMVLQSIHKIALAVFVAGRVVLSSDSDIKYIVVTAYNSYKNVALKMACNIYDIKSHFYMRISHFDFDSRKLLEIGEGSLAVANMVEDRHDIFDQEYVGRLIASQINMLSKTDVILAQMPRLQYVATENETLIFSISEIVGGKSIYLFENILSEKTKDYSKKYNMFFKGVKVVASGGEDLLIK